MNYNIWIVLPLVLSFLGSYETAVTKNQIKARNSNAKNVNSEIIRNSVIKRYLMNEGKAQRINETFYMNERNFFKSIGKGQRYTIRRKRWLILKERYNITNTAHTLFSPCNVSQVLWPDGCERASEPNQDRMKCVSLHPLLPPMCVCKRIRVNNTHIVTMRFDASRGICLSPEYVKCTHRWNLHNGGEQIFFAFGDQQCDQPMNWNDNNELQCSYPNPRRFSAYPNDVAFCLAKRDRLDEYEKIHFNGINDDREDHLTVEELRRHLNYTRHCKYCGNLHENSSRNLISTSYHLLLFLFILTIIKIPYR